MINTQQLQVIHDSFTYIELFINTMGITSEQFSSIR